MARDDMPGIAAMLLGLVVLVLTGVGLSLIVDNRAANTHRQDDLVEITTQGDARLRSLRAEEKEKFGLTETQAAKHDRLEAEYEQLTGHIAAAKKKAAQLTATKAEVGAALLKLPGDFEAYRIKFRQHAWQAAAGEKHQTIKLRSGRVFENVVIKQVTEVGLEIRHQEGIARIDAKDLDDSWHQRFQWDLEQRQATLDKENKAIQAMRGNHAEQQPHPSPASVTTGDGTMPSNATRAPDAVNPERLRAAVLFWKGKVSSLQTEYREANYNKTHGKSRSAPGSLESWDSKAARLQVELSRTRVSLQLAIAKLAEASPSDPLLSGTASEP